MQAISFLSGIAVIRLLSIDEYAYYTLANTMLGTMTILANGGVTAGVMVQGGKVWKDRQMLGAVLACGIQLRRTLAFYSFAVAGPVLAWLLLHAGASPWMVAGILLALLPTFVSTLSSRILDIPLRLHQTIWPLQRIQVEAGLLRLAAVVPALLAWPSAIAAVLLAGFSQIYANLRLRRVSEPLADSGATPDPKARAEIVALVRQVLPNAIYFSFSSQIAVWLVSIFGSAAAIAQVGALSRIGLALAVIKSVIMTLVVPRFTRLPEQSPLLLRRFWLVQGTLWSIALVSLLAISVFADPILWLLGPEYAGLKWELMLMAASSLVALGAFTTERLNEARAWVVPPHYLIPASLALQILLAAVLKPSSAAAAFTYGLIVQMAIYISYIAFFSWKSRSHLRVGNG